MVLSKCHLRGPWAVWAGPWLGDASSSAGLGTRVDVVPWDPTAPGGRGGFAEGMDI